MITQIESITVYVTDQDRALQFFVDQVGFEQRADRPFMPGSRWIEVAPPGSPTVLILANWFDAGTDRFSRIVFSTDDIHATYEAMHSRGVQFSEAPTMQPWGMLQAQFTDPDGNSYVLVQPA